MNHWRKPTVQVEEMACPKPAQGEVLLRVAYCGICGSDFSMTAADADGLMQYPGLAHFPLIPGHEFSATIVAFGEGNQGAWRVGDPVVAEETSGCAVCDACRNGLWRYCSEIRKTGFTHAGALAAYVTVPVKSLWSAAPLIKKFGGTQGLRLAALVQPYAIPFSAFFGGASKHWVPGARVLVVGGGPIGFAAADLAQCAGAAAVVLVERDRQRREKLAVFSQSTLVEVVESIPAHGEFDWVVDAAGVMELSSELLDRSAPHGLYLVLARTGKVLGVDAEKMAHKNVQISVVDGHSFVGAYPRIMALMASEKLHPNLMIDRTVLIEEAGEILRKQARGTGKILVEFQSE